MAAVRKIQHGGMHVKCKTCLAQVYWQLVGNRDTKVILIDIHRDTVYLIHYIHIILSYPYAIQNF